MDKERLSVELELQIKVLEDIIHDLKTTRKLMLKEFERVEAKNVVNVEWSELTEEEKNAATIIALSSGEYRIYVRGFVSVSYNESDKGEIAAKYFKPLQSNKFYYPLTNPYDWNKMPKITWSTE